MSAPSRVLLRLLVGAGVMVLIGCASVRPDRAIDVASGLISHNLCSLVFVSGLEPARAYDESLAPRPGMGLINWAVHYDVDVAQRSVRTTVAGGGASLAIHRDGLGCLLVRGDQPPDAPPAAAGQSADTPAHPARLPEIAGPALVEPDDARLRAALDRAFADSAHGPRGTTAVVVVHDGRVIAERYAPGYGVDTPLLGYSASKSVLSALIGILVRQQRLTVEQAAPVAAWAAADDPRRAITIDQLLRMTSGLALEESGSPFCPVARMLYLERDMAGFAERAALHGEPGRTWNYTSGNTIILSRILRDAVGGHADDVLRFAQRELFDPLGMRGVTLELDATGTPVGSTYMLAPARDWARFGLLYLHDGIVAGQRILPDGWVDYSTTPTLDTGYGAGFWTNRVDGDIPWSPAPWGIPGAPRDTFYARGLLGQYVVVVPSARLVVVRFGVTHVPRQDIDGVGQLLTEVIAALPSDEARGRPGRVRGRPHRAAPTGFVLPFAGRRGVTFVMVARDRPQRGRISLAIRGGRWFCFEDCAQGGNAMKVTYLGHAAIMVETQAVRILMDPWLTDPAYHGSWWHYPPLPFRVRDLPHPDVIYISHEHADHFDPPTLAQLDKDVQIVIGDFRHKRFRDRIAALGFGRIRELRFGELLPCGDLELFLIPPDRPWDDSAILLTDGETTVLNVNDCHLDRATLERLGREHDIDLAFLTFTGASQYPGCFDFPEAVKRERWRASKKAHLDEFVEWAKTLRPRRAVPAAGNFALLPPDLLPLNTGDYVNHPGEAIEALRAAAPEIEGVQMNPGDVWTPHEGLTRLNPAPDWSRRLEQIAAMSRAHAADCAAYYANEPAAPADLYERFRRYFDALLAADAAARERVGIVTWWHVEGAAGGDWTIDFRRDRDWVRPGVPDDWNLRLAFPERLLWKGLREETPWEDLVLSFRVRLARRPDRYMEGFWTWFCKLQGLERDLARAGARAA